MTGDFADDSGHEFVYGSSGQFLSASADEERGDPLHDGKCGAGTVSVVEQRGAGGGAERHDSFLRAFPENSNGSVIPVEVRFGNPDNFAHTECAGVHEFPECKVAKRDGVARVGSDGEVVQHVGHGRLGDDSWQVAWFFRCRQSRRDVGRGVSPCVKPVEQALHCGYPTRD